MGNFATIYALSCGEILSPKVHLWRKNDKYEVWIATKKEHLATSTIAAPTQQRVREKKSTARDGCAGLVGFPCCAVFFDIDIDNIFPALVAHFDLN